MNKVLYSKIALPLLLLVSVLFFFFCLYQYNSNINYFGNNNLFTNLWISANNPEVTKIQKVRNLSGFVTNIDYDSELDRYALSMFYTDATTEIVLLPVISENTNLYIVKNANEEPEKVSKEEFISNIKENTYISGSLVTNDINSNLIDSINFLYLKPDENI